MWSGSGVHFRHLILSGCGLALVGVGCGLLQTGVVVECGQLGVVFRCFIALAGDLSGGFGFLWVSVIYVLACEGVCFASWVWVVG